MCCVALEDQARGTGNARQACGALPLGDASALLRLFCGRLPVQTHRIVAGGRRMIKLADKQPDVSVQLPEYQRLLGYPKGFVMEGRAVELAAWARAWYSEHGRPWVYARQAARLDYAADKVCIDGTPFHSVRLAQTLEQAESTIAVLVAVSAGPELEQEADRLWRAEKPDEYFFLETYGS